MCVIVGGVCVFVDQMKAVVLCFLIWSLVEVHSQTVPYVSFMGDILPNHAYVNLATLGENIGDPGDTVRCHTDLNTCCTGTQGSHRGDWFSPDGTALANAVGSGDIYKSRGAQVIHLRRRNNAMSPSGIYHCEIPTVGTIMGESLYVGLYPPNEGIYIHVCMSYAKYPTTHNDLAITVSVYVT